MAGSEEAVMEEEPIQDHVSISEENDLLNEKLTNEESSDEEKVDGE